MAADRQRAARPVETTELSAVGGYEGLGESGRGEAVGSRSLSRRPSTRLARPSSYGLSRVQTCVLAQRVLADLLGFFFAA
jgi:hypothetical protein